MTLAVSSSLVSENALRIAAENVRDDLLELPSVSRVTLRGTRDREIAIELSEEELRRHGLSFRDVSGAVRRASVKLTFGELRTKAGNVILHTVAKRLVGADFEDIPVISRLDGTIVTLGDVAAIRDGFVDEDVISEVNGQPTVFVRIDAAERESIVDMADEIRTLLASYEAPRDIAVSIWNDRAGPALDRLSEIARNGVMGAILVFITLVLVFDLRVATWIAVGIPLSFVGALIFFAPADMTLNMGTLFGLFLLIGIVVDDAVVVGESIAAERERGLSARDAAISGARAMVGPHHHRSVHDDPRIPAVSLHHGRQLSVGQSVSLRCDLRAPRLPGRGVLHSSGSPVVRKAVEPVAAARSSDSGSSRDRQDSRQRGGTGGFVVGAPCRVDSGPGSASRARIADARALGSRSRHHFRRGHESRRPCSGGSVPSNRHALRGNAHRGRAFRVSWMLPGPSTIDWTERRSIRSASWSERPRRRDC